jgi:hypothetical protein
MLASDGRSRSARAHTAAAAEDALAAGRPLGHQLAQLRQHHRIRRIEMSLSSLRALAAAHEGTPPRALRLSIADFERQLDEALRPVVPPLSPFPRSRS